MAFSSAVGLAGAFVGSEFCGSTVGGLLAELSQRARQAVRAVWQLTTHVSPGAGGGWAGVAMDGGGAYTSVGAGVAM